MPRWRKDPKGSRTTFGGLSRSELMSRIRSAGNVTTEIKLANLLRKHRLTGWRRRLPLPGKPDFAWPQAKVAVFVDGCFWHGHTCARNLTPKTNPAFWEEKIQRNRARDRRVARRLRKKRWSVIRIWECGLAKDPPRCIRRIAAVLRRRQNRNWGTPMSNPVKPERRPTAGLPRPLFGMVGARRARG
jgi:DNA mismatch endonuclease (patch repair protein)